MVDDGGSVVENGRPGEPLGPLSLPHPPPQYKLKRSCVITFCEQRTVQLHNQPLLEDSLRAPGCTALLPPAFLLGLDFSRLCSLLRDRLFGRHFLGFCRHRLGLLCLLLIPPENAADFLHGGLVRVHVALEFQMASGVAYRRVEAHGGEGVKGLTKSNIWFATPRSAKGVHYQVISKVPFNMLDVSVFPNSKPSSHSGKPKRGNRLTSKFSRRKWGALSITPRERKRVACHRHHEHHNR